MQHLDDGFLHALADGEIPSEELVAVREHLEQCESCRARLDEARMEAETARELVELIEVPALIPAERRSGVAADLLHAPSDRPTVRPSSRWMRTLAWAATLVLAAGIGYYGRGEAPFAPAAEPISVAAKIDTVFLDIPAEAGAARATESNREAPRDEAPRPSQPRSVPPANSAPPARQDAAGARQEMDASSKRRIGGDTTISLNDIVVTGVAEGQAAQRKAAQTEKKEAEDKLGQSDARARSSANLARKNAPAPAAPAVAEERLMAKVSADAAAVVVTFPRAVELLGGRIKLIEGMVPSRLEAVGRTVRVIYTIDEGELMLAQVAGADTLNWNLSGPIGADSLARLRLRVR